MVYGGSGRSREKRIGKGWKGRRERRGEGKTYGERTKRRGENIVMRRVMPGSSARTK